ncbi:CHASE3 domain-containing protein [Adhaeribacter aquaticus]|uniref:sensor histidine kinase n=1 Tax=Adhaeribacter aquaticus TaxID=299567 RepID=UPI0004047CF0|nr:CHASE3 domain-containing protein [Adhaeribacter aquaticus]
MKLSTKLFAGFVIICFIFTAASILNFRLSEDVLENSSWLSKSQEVRRSSAALQLSITDMETGMRGFLLTGNEAFLEPYTEAAKELPHMFSSLTKLVEDSPEQTRQIKRIREIHYQWYNHFSDPLIREKRTQNSNITSGIKELKNADDLLNLQGRQMVDEMRTLFRDFNAIEYKVRQERADKLSSSIKRTRLISFVLTILSVFVGLSWAYYISKSITRRIVTMVKHAQNISQGKYQVQIEDFSQDELSNLSKSLNIMAFTIQSTIEELEAKNKELDQFAYIVSHDLKAPLRGIDNASKWIEEDLGDNLPENVQEYLRLMRTRVHRMENLINGILALARIGRGKELQEVVNVKDLLLETIDLLSAPKHIAIEILTEMPTIYTVRFHLQQVFSNLISNAIKYHDKPKGLISISCQDNNQHYSFSVTDDGPGIDAEYHERIFIVFQTLQERDAVESTGVGLAIVKKIIDRHGGTITVTSELGKGATFTFTWPKTFNK